MIARKLFWLVLFATLGVYAVMLAWSLPKISSEAAGLTAFDMRPSGYSHAEALTFLSALTPEGTNFYLSVQHRLDLLYPALLAITTGWAMVRLAPRWRWWPAFLLVPIAGMVFDYLENSAVAAMLTAGANELTPEIANRASTFSQLKAAMVTLSLSLLVIMIAAWAFRRWRARVNAE